MKVIITFLLATFFLVANGQERGDLDYVFTSLEEAKKTPEIVFNLSLQKQKLVVFPNELVGFKNLRSLDLSKNKLSLIPIEIKNLKQLEVLNLSKNKISRIPPAIGALSELESLLLAKNDIEKVPKEIGALSSLKVLDLWSNNIKEIHSDIQKIAQLERIDLRGILLSDQLKENLSLWLPETKILTSGGCDCGF